MLSLLENIKTELKSDRISLKLLMYEKGVETIKDVAIYHCNKEVINLIDDIIYQKEPYLVSHLDITGEDVAALGFKGKEIGMVLDRAIRLVISGEIKNNKQDLIKKLSIV